MRIPAVIILLVVYQGMAYSAPAAFRIDNTHSSIQFTIPFFGVADVAGRFDRFCGQFNYDEADLSASSIELYIDAASINTSLNIRDRDLRKSFFETEKFPVISFRSTVIAKSAAKQLKVTGILSIHGVTREIEITLVIMKEITNDGAPEMGIKLLPVLLDRKAFKIMDGSMGAGTIGDTVAVNAFIRLRDRTRFRAEFDQQYPDKQVNNTLPFQGSYKGKSGINIALITDGGKYFISFNDDSWQWMDQAKLVGINSFKMVSFNHLMEVKPGVVMYQRDPNKPAEILIRETKPD